MGDLLFEKRINKLLKILKEQGEETQQRNLPLQQPQVTGTDAATVNIAQQGRERIARQQAAQDVAQATQTRQQPEEVRTGAQKVADKQIKFMATNDMYTAKPPVDSSNWPEEANKKKWMVPLRNGSVGAALVEHVAETFTPTGPHTSAKFSDYQFRIILRGNLNANATILAEIKRDDKALFRLKELSLDTPLTAKGKITTIDKTQFEGKEGLKDAIVIEGDTGNFFKKEYQNVLFGKEELEALKKSEKESAPEEPEKETKFYDVMVDAARANSKSINIKSGDVKKYIDWLLNIKNEPKSEIEAVKMAVNKDNADRFSEEIKKEETINLQDYLKSLLLEKKKSTELEKELGGSLINELNTKIFKQWFGVNKIAAMTSSRIFEGAIWEWFACSSAMFKPKERRDVTETAAGNMKLEFDGILVMEAELWFDARVGEDGNQNTWSFRVHDKPNTPILIKKFKLLPPDTIKKQGLSKKEAEVS